jgi:hypothetical protein
LKNALEEYWHMWKTSHKDKYVKIKCKQKYFSFFILPGIYLDRNINGKR